MTPHDPRARPPLALGPLPDVRVPRVIPGGLLVSGVWVEGDSSYYRMPQHCRIGAAVLEPANQLVVMYVDGRRADAPGYGRRLTLHRTDLARSRDLGGPTRVFEPPDDDILGVQTARRRAASGTDALFVAVTATRRARHVLPRFRTSVRDDALERFDRRLETTSERAILVCTVPGHGGPATVDLLVPPLPPGHRLARIVPGVACSPDGETLLAFVHGSGGRAQLIEVGRLELTAGRVALVPVSRFVAPDGADENLAVAYDSRLHEWAVFFVSGAYRAYVQLLDGAMRPLGAGPQLVFDGNLDSGTHSGHQIAFNPRTGRYLVATAHNQLVLERVKGRGEPLECVRFDNSRSQPCDVGSASPQVLLNPFSSRGWDPATGTLGELGGYELGGRYGVAAVAQGPWEFMLAAARSPGSGEVRSAIRAAPPEWRTAQVALAEPVAPDRVRQVHAVARAPRLPGLACVWLDHPLLRAGGPGHAPAGEIHCAFLSDVADRRFA